MRESKDLTRKQLIAMIGALRGSILDVDTADRQYIYIQTAFDVSQEDDAVGDRSWMLLSKVEKLLYCKGCHNDDYNNGLGGAKECWSLDSAKLVKMKFVHMNHVPPWEHAAEETLSCHYKDGFIKVDPDRTC